MEIGTWLRTLGLGQHEAAFRENEVDADVLTELTDQQLKDMGIALGHRLKLLRAIRELADRKAQADQPFGFVEPQPRESAERRQLTVLFCDLVGSTALSTRLDPEDMRGVIRAYQDAVAGVVARYDGFVAKFMGDGVVAYFGFPRAHEDDAARAVHAGLELVQVVASLRTAACETLGARIGVATGIVVVGDIVGHGAAQEQAVVGDTPNLAARLQGLADAGGVVISAATRRLVGDEFHLKNLGRHAVKGLAEPVEAFAPLGVASKELRFEAAHPTRLTGFVGRETEAADLLARQRHAWEGRGQIVLISGEAGIGKSRLSAWVAEQSAEIPHTTLRYQCSPYHRDSALFPFAQQFERAASFATQDGPDAKLDKLEAVLALATDRLGEVAPLIAAMLSIPTGARYPPLRLSPAQQRRQTLFALIDQMEGLARKQPILMLFEDAQWADATSLELLDLAIERMRNLPVLSLITFRTEFEAPWRGLPRVAEIALGRLDRSEAEALVERVTGGRKMPTEVLAQIVAKTDGVPLFVEELTKSVLESGLLIEQSECYRLDGPLPPLAIPSTLQDSLMARLDRFAAVKEIAQVAAAIGREFSYPLLQAVVGRDEATLRASLKQLEESGLVFRSGEPAAARYTFKHALVQDTAYESMLKSRRQILHQRIAEALRDKFPDVVETEPELIAEHFTRAALPEPAIVHWGKAGDRALRRSAFKEAIAHLGKAIEMMEAGGTPGNGASASGHRLKLQSKFCQAVMWSKGFGAAETDAAFARAAKLSAETGDTASRTESHYAQFGRQFFRGALRSAQEVATNFLRAAESSTQSTEVGLGHRNLGLSLLLQGDFVRAKAHLEQSQQVYDSVSNREAKLRPGSDAAVLSNACLAFADWGLGSVASARRLIDEACESEIGSVRAPTLAIAYHVKAVLETLWENGEAAERAAEIEIALCREHDIALFLALGTLSVACARAQRSERGRGSAELRQALADYTGAGYKLYLPFYFAALAKIEAEGQGGESGLVLIDEALALAAETAEHWYDAELYRTRGEFLLKQFPADPAPAEEAYMTAIAIAQEQKSRSFELRAALALSKLYRSTGRPIEAHNVLSPALKELSSTPEFPEIAEAEGLVRALTAHAHAGDRSSRSIS